MAERIRETLWPSHWFWLPLHLWTLCVALQGSWLSESQVVSYRPCLQFKIAPRSVFFSSSSACSAWGQQQDFPSWACSRAGAGRVPACILKTRLCDLASVPSPHPLPTPPPHTHTLCKKGCNYWYSVLCGYLYLISAVKIDGKKQSLLSFHVHKGSHRQQNQHLPGKQTFMTWDRNCTFLNTPQTVSAETVCDCRQKQESEQH